MSQEYRLTISKSVSGLMRLTLLFYQIEPLKNVWLYTGSSRLMRISLLRILLMRFFMGYLFC